MIRSLWISKTGLDAQQTQMDVISNNLANVSTNGFKRSRAVFEDLLYQTLRQPGAQSSQQTQLPSGLQLGTGVRPVATERIFTQGNPQQTNNDKDVAINGDGFFQVLLPDGTTAYTRDGSFQTDSQGQLVTSSGYPIQPAIQAPDGTESYTRAGDLKINENGVLQTQSGHNVLGDSGPITVEPQSSITIASDGTVSSISLNGTPNAVNIVGRLKLVNPPPNTMVRGDDGLFRQADGTDADADANVSITPGALESSNVNPVEAMVSMINLSRQFDLHMKMLTTVESNEAKATSIMTL